MKINFKARLRNKAFVVTMATLLVTFVYQVLGAFDIVPAVTESSVMELIGIIVNVLGVLGILVDPTTPGVKDSDLAMTYYNTTEQEEE